jgi:transcriptional regulator
MHPNPAVEWSDEAEMLGFVAERAFGHVFTATAEGLFVVHAPLVVAGKKVQFHVSRRNRIAEHLAGNPLLISVSGRQAYQSPNWYASENQVGTWHYESVEIEGTARPLAEAELVEFLDLLSETMEARYSPQRPWIRAKMERGKFDAMLQAIIGFELDPSEIRGTRKFNQQKSGDDLEATINGQLSVGREDIVAAIRELTAND